MLESFHSVIQLLIAVGEEDDQEVGRRRIKVMYSRYLYFSFTPT